MQHVTPLGEEIRRGIRDGGFSTAQVLSALKRSDIGRISAARDPFRTLLVATTLPAFPCRVPPLYVFREMDPFFVAAQDAESEASVQQALDTLVEKGAGSTTVVLVAHR